MLLKHQVTVALPGHMVILWPENKNGDCLDRNGCAARDKTRECLDSTGYIRIREILTGPTHHILNAVYT